MAPRPSPSMQPDDAKRGNFITWGSTLVVSGLGFIVSGPDLGWFLLTVGIVVSLRGHFPHWYTVEYWTEERIAVAWIPVAMLGVAVAIYAAALYVCPLPLTLASPGTPTVETLEAPFVTPNKSNPSPRPHTETTPTIRITSYEIAPYTVGKKLEIKIHIAPLSITGVKLAVVTDPYVVTNPASGYVERRDFENQLWDGFESRVGLAELYFLTVPSSLDAWTPVPMEEVRALTAEDIQGTISVRFYFLSRVFDAKGRGIVDSCIFIDPSVAERVALFCVNHNQ